MMSVLESNSCLPLPGSYPAIPFGPGVNRPFRLNGISPKPEGAS